MNRIP